MAELPNDDDLLHQHALNVDELLSETDYGSESPLNMSAGFMNGPTIWSNCSSNDFGSPYNGYHGGDAGSAQWPPYCNSFSSGSPVKEGLLSSPESDAGSDHSWRCDSGVNGINISKASISEAIAQWSTANGGTNGIYDPFRSSSVIDDLDGMQDSKAQRDKSPLRRSQSANSRPTFADVAKKPSPPGSEPPPTPSLSTDGPIYGSQESLNSLQEKRAKQRAFRPAHPRHGSYHVPLPINPDSKYGLDDFEVQEANVGKLERSFSCNDALGCSSKGGVHDMNHFADEERGGGDKQPASEASTQHKREWFDPKRIFMNGSARTRSESVPCDTILNNAAPK